MQGIFVCSANLCEGDQVSVWCDLDDHRKSNIPTASEDSKSSKSKPSQGGLEKLEDKAIRDAAKKLKKEEARLKEASGDGAVLRGSALHKYKGRRLKLGSVMNITTYSIFFNEYCVGDYCLHVHLLLDME